MCLRSEWGRRGGGGGGGGGLWWAHEGKMFVYRACDILVSTHTFSKTTSPHSAILPFPGPCSIHFTGRCLRLSPSVHEHCLEKMPCKFPIMHRSKIFFSRPYSSLCVCCIFCVYRTTTVVMTTTLPVDHMLTDIVLDTTPIRPLTLAKKTK